MKAFLSILFLLFIFIYMFPGKIIENNNEKSNFSELTKKYKTENLSFTQKNLESRENSSVKKSEYIENDRSVGLSELPENIKKLVLDDLNTESNLNISSIEDSGFDKSGVDKIKSKDPNKLLSIAEMPEELRSHIRSNLEKRKNNGYDETSEYDVNEITGILNYIVGNDYPIPKLAFTPSKLPSLIAIDYQYIGYTYPNIQNSQAYEGTFDTLRRVFQNLKDSSLLIIEETSLHNGSSTFIKDFVNEEINGNPAMYSLKRSSSGKEYSMLNWSIGNGYTYALYKIGDHENIRPVLLHIGHLLSNINVAQKIPEESTDNKNHPL